MKILATTPSRISLFGGGTDVEPYATTYQGVVVSIAINLRQRIIMYEGDDIFEVTKNVFPANADPYFCYSILEKYKINSGHFTKIQSYYDGFVGAGLGSSASFIVGLLGAIYRRLHRPIIRSEIAAKAWELENIVLKHYCGKQDHYAATYGGCNLFHFGKETYISQVKIADNILDSLVLIYIGKRETELSIQKHFKTLSQNKKDWLDKMKYIALDSVRYLIEGNISKVSDLLKTSWSIKRSLDPSISNDIVDKIYQLGIQQGALAGKLLGSGGGGHMVFMVDPDKKHYFIEKMKGRGFENTDFSICYNGLETRIL